MMKILHFKYLIILLFLPLALMANGGKMGGKFTKEKTIDKEFKVSPTALFKVKNSYGNLKITSWNENRIVIKVHIKTNGNNEEKVIKRLEEIDVDFENSKDNVSAITRFGERKNNWGWGWKSNNVNVQVNYTIKLPVKNSVHLNNDYGHIYLDRIDGHAKISCDYGKMEIGELRGRNNELRFDYTSRSSFDYINSAEIIADYSGFVIQEANNLKLRCDYTNADIRKAENIDYSSDYGSLEADMVKNISGNGDYYNLRLGKVSGDVTVNADYGSVKIAEMQANAGNVNIRTDYTGIKIGYSPDYHFDFEISTEYAGVKGKEDLEINIRKEKSSERFYKGFYGSSGTGKTISIDSEYGNVNFYKN